MQSHDVLFREGLDSLVRSDGRYYDINFFEYRPENIDADSLPASCLFHRVLSLLPVGEVPGRLALAIRQQLAVNTTLWGLRNEGGKYTLEYYFYYPWKFPHNRLENVVEVAAACLGARSEIVPIESVGDYYLSSLNLVDGKVTDVTAYRSILDPDREPFFVADRGIWIDAESPRFVSYSLMSDRNAPREVNTYYGFFDSSNLSRVLARIHELARVRFPQEDPLLAYRFLDHVHFYGADRLFRSCMVALKEEAIGLYLYGLKIGNFIRFLRIHDYDEGFIRDLESSSSRFAHIRFDVGMDFFLHEGEFHVKKTAFWGTF